MSSNKQTKAGSLKDRIAQFNNPDSSPLVPKSAFGYGAPTKPESSQIRGKGLIGNRIPSYNAKNIAAEMIVGAPKKVENRGLYGNRIPALAKPDSTSKLPAEAHAISEGNEGGEETRHSALQGDVSTPPAQEVVEEKTLVLLASSDGDARKVLKDALPQGSCRGAAISPGSPDTSQEAAVTGERSIDRLDDSGRDGPVRLRMSDQVQQSSGISQSEAETKDHMPANESTSHSAVSMSLGPRANAAFEREQPCEPAPQINDSAAETVPNHETVCVGPKGDASGLMATNSDVQNQNLGSALLESQRPIIETREVERIDHPSSVDTKQESTSEAGSGDVPDPDQPADGGKGESHMASKHSDVTAQDQALPEQSLAAYSEPNPTDLDPTTKEPGNGQQDPTVSDFHAQFARAKTGKYRSTIHDADLTPLAVLISVGASLRLASSGTSGSYDIHKPAVSIGKAGMAAYNGQPGQ